MFCKAIKINPGNKPGPERSVAVIVMPVIDSF